MCKPQKSGLSQDTFSLADTNALKGLAIILMFYHHLFAFPDRIAEGIEYQALFEIFGVTSAYAVAATGKICVAIFVFLGGYGTYISCTRSDNIACVIQKRFKSMYTSFWKVFVVFIPICMLADVKRVTKAVGDVILNFIGLKTNYNREWWFFAPYLILILMMPIIKRLVDKFKSLFWGLAFVCVTVAFSEFLVPCFAEASGLIEYDEHLLYVLIANTVKLLPGFAGGCVFARFDVLTRIKTRLSGNIARSVSAIALSGVIVCVRGLIGEDYDYLLIMLFVPAVTVALNNKPGAYIHKLLNVIGRESTNMWLIHSFYCYYLIQKIVYAPYYTPLIALWLLILTFASSKLLNLFWKGTGSICNKALKLTKIKTA